jgi:hypothetical protein
MQLMIVYRGDASLFLLSLDSCRDELWINVFDVSGETAKGVSNLITSPHHPSFNLTQ